MRLIKMVLLAIGLMSAAAMAQVPVVSDPTPDPQNILHLQISTGGEVLIALRPDKAPGHVTRIKTLVRSGFYDGLLFHRVIEGFMAQTGDPKGTGEGGSPLPDLKAEFNDLPHLRGSVSMARTDNPNSANSQFFICFLPAMKLDGKYTVFGRVISGMSFVDLIERGEPPASPSRILKAWIESDGANAPRQTLVIPPPEAAMPAVSAPVTPPAMPTKPVKKKRKKIKIF
jgi:cyclophilin family peptidyl-prolyl cis-trans isomerase